MRGLFLFLFLLLTGPAALAEVTPAERRMIETIDAEAERSITLLERMVNQNSGTLNFDGVRRVGEMIREELEPLGFDVDWVNMSEAGRAGHIVATHQGSGRNVLLLCHLDTVFEPDSPFQRFERQGMRATGPGVGDCKGGNVVIIAALRAMHAAGTLADASIAVIFTGDEERPGAPISLSRRDLVAAGGWADAALEFENLARQDGRDYATVARRSSTSWTLRTQGRTGHSSGIFREGLGYGAIYEMARILDEFRRELPEENLTYNVGVMAGGTPTSIDDQGFRVTASGKTNIVAESAIARGDLRALTREQERRVQDRMRSIVARHLPGTSAELEFSENGYPPMEPTEGNRRLLERLNEVNRDLGLPAMPELDPARRGAADSAFVAFHTDVLGGMGVAGGGAHAEDEWIDLESISLQAKRAALLVSRLSRP